MNDEVPANVMDTVRSYITSNQKAETAGRMTVTFGNSKTPMLARDFAKVLVNLVRALEETERCVAGKTKTTWAMSEAAIIDGMATFTIWGCDKAELKKFRAKNDLTQPSPQS